MWDLLQAIPQIRSAAAVLAPRPFGASQVLPVQVFSSLLVGCLVLLLLFRTNAGFTDLLVCSLMKTPDLGTCVCSEVRVAVEDELGQRL